MAKKLPTVWSLKKHTTAKHTILRVYLEAWLPIMGMRSRVGYLTNGRLVIVDAFSGPGVYAGGEPGSPIIMLNAFLKHTMVDRIESELVYVFIDEDAKRIARLKEEVAKLGQLPDQVKVDYIRGRYEDEFAAVLDGLEEAGHKLAPTFAFIDPFGYSDAPMSLTGRFLQFDRCEVLIYVPLPDINRFLTRAQQEEAFNSLFGGADWEAAKALSGPDRLRFLHDLFKRKLEDDCNLDYVRSFQIVAKHAARGYLWGA
jgi:three-Cys-motif partner protein